MAGTYKLTAEWGSSTLTLNSDHTFTQSVSTNTGVTKRGSGTWELAHDGWGTWGDTVILRQKYLWVLHDKQGEDSDGAFASAERRIFGGVEISADPDYGIAFRK